MAKGSYSKYETEFAEDAKEWIDERVYGAGKAVYRGSMEVLASGFGKGVLIAAAAIAATIFVGAVVAPGLTFGADFANISVALRVQHALPAIGNFLLGSWESAAILATSGATGSLVSAWSENSRIGKESAECQAARYAKAREAGGVQPALEQTKLQSQSVGECLSEGHCARLLREQQAMQVAAR